MSLANCPPHALQHSYACLDNRLHDVCPACGGVRAGRALRSPQTAVRVPDARRVARRSLLKRLTVPLDAPDGARIAPPRHLLGDDPRGQYGEFFEFPSINNRFRCALPSAAA